MMRSTATFVLGVLMAGPVAQAAVKTECLAPAKKLVKAVVASGTLSGRFLDEAPTVKLTRTLIIDDYEEAEVYTFTNSQGENTVTLSLARGLCELRSFIHNVSL